MHYIFGSWRTLQKTTTPTRWNHPTPPSRLQFVLYPRRHLSTMVIYTSPTKKARICRDKAAGMTNTAVAQKFGLHRTTVQRIFDRYAKSEDYYVLKQKPGRPRLFTKLDTHFAVHTLAAGKARDVSELQQAHFPNINAETIRSRLRQCGLQAYVRRTKPYLSETHREKRLAWAKAHAHWTAEDWRAVIFSDESKFKLFGSDGRQYCWRMPGQAFDEKFTKKVVKHGGGSVMVWGCLTSNGSGRIVRIEGNMDAELYVQILDDDFLGTLGDLGIKKKNIYFQQDNDPKHTSKRATEWFGKNKVDKLDWPPNSPDMNIIEHAWDHLDRRVRTRTPLPRNVGELWEALVEEWGHIDQDFIMTLFESMPRRVQALLEAKGGHTKY